MKRSALRLTALLFLSLLLSASCGRTLRDTNRGNMYVSFRVDGERFTCEKKNVLYMSPMRLSFYDEKFLDFHVDCYDAKEQGKKGCLVFTISDTEAIETGKKYNLGYYEGSVEDRVAEPPVFFAEFNGYRSTEGWVKLRSIKRYKEKEGYLVISGNFEFTAKDANGNTVQIKYGTFDGIY